MTRILTSLMFLALAVEPRPASGVEDAAVHSFGTVRHGAPVEHEFKLHNGGTEPLRIAGVQISPPMELRKMPAVVAPGTDAALKVALDTSVVKGDYEGKLLVALTGENTPREYAMTGKIVPAVEAVPLPAVFLSTSKGVEKSASIELVSHEDGPIKMTLPTEQHAVYKANLATVEPGKKFRLTISVPADAPAGRISDRIELASTGAIAPKVPIGVNVIVRERVYTFPDTVDFGSLDATSLKGDPTRRKQTLMVYSTGSRDFKVEAKSDIPGLELRVEPGPDGDRAQITLSLADASKAGQISGKVLIRTNDPQFRELTVPISGTVTD